MWQTFGHQAAKQLFDKQLDNQRFPHAYLFVGPVGIGKKTLARELAGHILQTDNINSHADYIFYDAADGSGMDGIRQFMSRLSSKPFVGLYKLAIVDNMDQANAQMSNALLKTLEEPSPSTILILIAGQNNLLPTIVSRCQTVALRPLTNNELSEYAALEHLKITDQISAASYGSPARLQSLVNNPELTEQVNQYVAQLEKAQTATTAQTSSTAAKLLAINDLAELEPEQLHDILLTWLYRYKQGLARQPDRWQTMARICEALTSLNSSFNKKMVLQRLLL